MNIQAYRKNKNILIITIKPIFVKISYKVYVHHNKAYIFVNIPIKIIVKCYTCKSESDSRCIISRKYRKVRDITFMYIVFLFCFHSMGN